MSDPVKSPDHYKAGQYECLDIMRARFGESAYKAFCTMNAFKYLFRAGRKAGVDGGEDAAKAKHYLELAPDCLMPDELERKLVEANAVNLRQQHELDGLRRRCLDSHIENDALQSELSRVEARLRSVEEQLTILHNATGDEQLAKLRKRKAK